MGSFNVGCAISNLSIGYGDKIGFMIIGKPKDYGYMHPDTPESPFYTYSSDLYKPFLPPIFGEYDDYGRIDNIQSSATTALIETMFHRPVKVAIDAICCSRGIYDDIGEIFFGYFAADKAVLKGYDIPAEEILTNLGFIQGKSKEDGTQDFVFNDFTVTMHGKDRYTISNHVKDQILKNKFYARNGTDLLEYFGQVTSVYPGYDSKEYNAISLLSSLTGTYFLEDVYHEMVTFIKADEYMKKGLSNFDKNWAELMVELEKSEDLYFVPGHLDALEYIQRETVFPYRDQQILEVYKGTDGFASMKSLVSVMHSLNRMLIPSFCGEQCGNNEFSLALNASTQKILEKRKEDYGDWE